MTDQYLTLSSEGNTVGFAEDRVPIMERVIVLDFKDITDKIREMPLVRTGAYCFFLFKGGKADIIVNDIEEKLRSKELVVGIPGDRWKWKSVRDVEGKLLIFDASFVLAGLRGGYTLEPISFLNSDSHHPFIPLSDRRFHRLSLLMDDMEECLSESPVFYDLLRAQLWEFIFLTEKEYVVNGNPGRRVSNPNYIPTFINMVNKFYRTSHETSFYAERMSITPNYLNKIVKKALGVSAYDYILSRIIAEAKILLRLTEITINELAYKLGFDDPNYFIRCFKKIEGMTPGQYQKRGTL